MPPLDFGIASLDGCKVKLGAVAARCHGRRGAAPKAN
jgi:hypothetical protein